ncbi:MAG: hypothetical protein Q7S05_01415 [bacterium]|nr:hypothetical protein [bacterium]
MKTVRHTSLQKRIAAALMLASLLAIVFFSFAAMTHASDGRMQSGCPFTAMGTPLCPQDLTAAAIHHISAYQSLLGAPVGAGMTALLLALVLLVYGVFIFFIRPPAPKPQLIRYLHGSPQSSARDRKTTRWLSLFENSPSLI